MLHFNRKRKNLLAKAIIALGGAAYFTMFSQLTIPLFIKGYVMIIPLQILALFYVLYVKTKESYYSNKPSN